MEYAFTLKYLLPDGESGADILVERLGAAGCDDAVVGIGLPGRLALEFTREAESAQAAIRSALSDVKQAIPTARLIEAGPDFVGLSDIAAFVGVSRQNMRKLMLTHRHDFPAPVHEGSVSLWHLAEVLAWLNGKGGYDLDESLLEISRATLEVNSAREAGRVPASTVRELKRLVA